MFLLSPGECGHLLRNWLLPPGTHLCSCQHICTCVKNDKNDKIFGFSPAILRVILSLFWDWGYFEKRINWPTSTTSSVRESLPLPLAAKDTCAECTEVKFTINLPSRQCRHQKWLHATTDRYCLWALAGPEVEKVNFFLLKEQNIIFSAIEIN